MLTTLLFPYLRTGRYDQAVEAHRRAYRIHRSKPDELADIGTHLRFCALTGNATRGLEILERHLSWLGPYTTPHDTAKFANSTALLLHQLPRATQVRTTGVVIGSDREQLRDRTEAGELADLLTVWAYEIGARFDERNGNTTYTDNLSNGLNAEVLVEHLPLSPHSRVRSSASRDTTPGRPNDSSSTEPVADSVSPNDKVRDHVDRGRGSMHAGRHSEALPELAEAVAELSALGPTVAREIQPDLGELWVDLGEAYLESDRAMDAAETLEQALVMIEGEHSEHGSEQPRPAEQVVPAVRRGRFLLGRAKLELTRSVDEENEAVTEMDGAVRAERQFGDEQRAASYLERFARDLRTVSRDTDSADRWGTAALLHARAGRLADEVRCRCQELVALSEDEFDDQAAATYEQIQELLDQRGHELGTYLPTCRAELSEAWADSAVARYENDDAAEQYAATVDRFVAIGETRAAIRARRKQGLAIYFGDDEEQALPVFADARAMLQDSGLDDKALALETAEVDFAEGRVLDFLGREDQARERLSAAVEAFERFGTERQARKARAYLGSI